MSFFSNRRQNQAEPVRKEATPLSSVSLTQRQPIGFETVLGANSVLDGTLESRANIRLDGVFTGTLKITGNVLVGETAEINADINAKNVSIAGVVKGNVSGKKVQLLRTAKVWGDISATALTTEEGAFIDGKISMNAPTVNEDDLITVDETVTHEADSDDNADETVTNARVEATVGDDTAVMPKPIIEAEIRNIQAEATLEDDNNETIEIDDNDAEKE